MMNTKIPAGTYCSIATAFQRLVWTHLQINSLRQNRVVHRSRQSDWTAECNPGGGPCLRIESYCCSDSVPQGCKQEWQAERVSLGCRAKEKIIGNGKICRGECLTTLPSLHRFLWRDLAYRARAVFPPLCSSHDLPKHWQSAGQSM